MYYWFEKALLSLLLTLDNPYFFKKLITTFFLPFLGRALESLQIQVKAIQNISK